ncbi:MAG: glycosyltransferase family 2 protein [Bryobacteraceae bacterium]
MTRLAIVIPTWNRAEMLAETLGSLGRQTHPIDRVIVVDNGSTDDTARVAAQAGTQVISIGANVGFAAAVNRGIRAADSAEFVGILNNDVTLTADWLAHLMGKLETTGAWFATGKLLDARAREQMEGSFDAICRGACAWRCGHGRPDSPLWNQPRTIQLAPLTAAVFRASAFERVGLLDERFESYLEDVDWGLRCAQAGLSGLYVPEAVAYHQGSGTLGRWHPDTVRKIARNQVLLIAKHYPPNWVLRYGWPVFIAQALWGFVALRHGALLSYLSGKTEGLRQFREARGKDCAGFPAVNDYPAVGDFSAIIEKSEKELHDLQQLTGFDLYWRLYFALT